MLSIVIPSRNEPYLSQTVDDIRAHAKGDIQLVIVLDGYWPDPIPCNDPRITLIHFETAHGMRAAINAGVVLSRGDFVLKCDAHCMFDDGFDTKLAASCEPNWVVVPRRKRLDVVKWALEDVGKPDVDYMYLSPELHGVNWDAKNRDRKLRKVVIDDLMSAQGSCWFMHRAYYDTLELLDEEQYGSFWSEFQEIGLKAWLSGGRVVVNKNTWYAHWHKRARGYSLNESESTKAGDYVKKWLTMGEAWHKQTLPIEWLVEKFAPVPGWPNGHSTVTS